MSTRGAFNDDLPKRPANHTPLTPNSFIDWAARVFPNRPAIAHGDMLRNYAQMRERCYALGQVLVDLGVETGDVVSVLAPNTPHLLEAHYGVPLIGAVLNAINVRLDAETIAYILDHAESKVFVVDPELLPLARAALAQAQAKPMVLSYVDAVFGPPADWGDARDIDALIDAADTTVATGLVEDEWQAIALNYTSGTTGRPKGVVYHHRGAYLVGINNQFSFRLAPLPVYLWTLPMFHCNGWGNTWAITKLAGLHVCLRQASAAAIYRAIDTYDVTHMSGAPVILNMLIHAPVAEQRKTTHTIHYTVGGAPPPAALLEKMQALNFNVTHGYGLTETYGPAGGCEWHPEWSGLPITEQADLKKRQGVPNHTLDDMTVLVPTEAASENRASPNLTPVPWDGEAMGEIMMRGNTVMKGYFKDAEATEAALADGWFHSGDLGAVDPDGYVELRDRSKDIIISGGENISSLEIEGVLFRHPSVIEAAVVAAPHEKWGETPWAFVDCGSDRPDVDADALIAWCRDNIAHYKCPTKVVFGALPKTSTGKVRKNVLREMARDQQGSA